MKKIIILFLIMSFILLSNLAFSQDIIKKDEESLRKEKRTPEEIKKEMEASFDTMSMDKDLPVRLLVFDKKNTKEQMRKNYIDISSCSCFTQKNDLENKIMLLCTCEKE